MLILVNESKFISILRDVSWPLRVLISSLSIAIILSIWFFLMYFPTVEQINDIKTNLDVLTINNKEMDHFIATTPILSLEKKIVVVKHDFSLQKNIDLLLNAVSLNKLSCIKFISKKGKQFVLSVQGEYFNIIPFLDSLVKINFEIKDFNIESINNNIIELTMHMSFLGK